MATKKYLVPLEIGEELVGETLHKLKHHEEDILGISGNSMESASHMVEIRVMSPDSSDVNRGLIHSQWALTNLRISATWAVRCFSSTWPVNQI